MKNNNQKRKTDFHTKKSLGQNFISDSVLLSDLVSLSGIPVGSNVLEIGTGLGTLTARLAEKAGHVTTVEIDDTLIPILQVSLADKRNVSLIHGNIMNLDLNEITRNMRPYHVVANIPYYITTDLLNKLILEGEDIASVSLMVQKEAAGRIMAEPGTEQYGMLAVVTALYGTASIAAFVPAECFEPKPKVDSCFVNILPYTEPRFDRNEVKSILRAASAAFMSRRKTYVNNLIGAYHISREDAVKAVTDNGFDPNVRGEEMGVEQFKRIGTYLEKRSGADR